MKIGQSKKHSFIEALINVAVGYGINIIVNFLVFPIFGMHISLKDNLLMGVIYTIISVIRSYWLRRFFNWMHVK